MASATITVTCMNMAGDKLAQFTLEPDAKFDALVDLVHEHIPLPVIRWTLILPTGETPVEIQSALDVQPVSGSS